MTELGSDLLKTVIDKVLLGLVIAAVGYYFSRLLENYRSRNAYAQAVAAQRIEACKALAAAVVEYHEHVLELFPMLDKVLDERAAGRTVSDDDARPGFDHIERHKRFKTQVLPLAVLMPLEVGKALNRYLDEANKGPNYVMGRSRDADWDVDELEKARFEFFTACYQSISENPFV